MKKNYISIFSMFLALFLLNGCGLFSGGGTSDTNTAPQSDTFPMMPQAESPVEDFLYQERNNGIIIIKYRGTDEQVVIPSTINNLPVTQISDLAFLETEGIKSVTLPTELTDLGDAAFGYCSELTAIYIAEDSRNFSSRDGVLFNKDKSVLVYYPTGKEGAYQIPDCVTSIGPCSFYRCLNLIEVTIPAGVSNISSTSFYDCPCLQAYNVDKDNSYFTSKDGILYSANQRQLISVPGGKSGRLEIPGKVTQIADYAFSKCCSLTDIILPDSVTEIGELAFVSCSKLTHIRLPNGLKEIKRATFTGCSGLTHISIPDSVIRLDDNVFFKCTSLSEIELPSALKSIGNRAFSVCTNLRKIVIPENVATVGAVLFQECSDVTIYVKQETQPAGWEQNWNHLNFPVVWGYTGS